MTTYELLMLLEGTDAVVEVLPITPGTDYVGRVERVTKNWVRFAAEDSKSLVTHATYPINEILVQVRL